jgi:hypothetical protein
MSDGGVFMFSSSKKIHDDGKTQKNGNAPYGFLETGKDCTMLGGFFMRVTVIGHSFTRTIAGANRITKPVNVMMEINAGVDPEGISESKTFQIFGKLIMRWHIRVFYQQRDNTDISGKRLRDL